MGVIDEAGRLRLLGNAVAGAAFAVVLTMLVLSSWTAATTNVLVSVGVPAAVLGAGIGVFLLLRSWRIDGGYERASAVQRWISDGRVPSDVPVQVWVPLLVAQAERQRAGWGKIVLAVFWTAMTWSMRDVHGTLITVLLSGLWVGLALWAAVVVIPRARVAAAILRREAAIPEPTTD
ncbi:hypothetical protein EDF24_0468 [Curtobacterium sp. PhB130]|uniref:hypothetical protein n=1 Tax=unclassified Curtobacterium TaxID=257496 RepID=UPI000FA45378|nr:MULTISPECIES: hypothetical protein [unclassified Curtobacterium]ROS77709.1 hypothetical protein EDF24_0468 [Curtobacterium sp. PhB130]TCK66083.1 hypothetical protein EDF27_0835 [Curtobacterium sp. PhB136]